MTRAARVLPLLVLGLAGCSLSGAELARSNIAQNRCKTDDECFGARCSPDGACVASDGTLTALLVTVTPPSTLSGVTSLTYYQSFESDHDSFGASGGGLSLAALDPGIDVTGTVSIDIDVDTAPCKPAFVLPVQGTSLEVSRSGYIPVDITFTPSEQITGVPTDVYHASLNSIDGVTFEVTSLPPGLYDVYVAPKPLVQSMYFTPDCQVPPQLYLKKPVTSGVSFALPTPSRLTVDVTWPLTDAYSDEAAASNPLFADPLQGWTVDLVEPNTGRALSAQATLGGLLKTPPILGDMSVTYETTLVYSPPLEIVDDNSQPSVIGIGNDVLRLTPPADATAPVVLVQLDGALVGADHKNAPAQIVQPALPPAPVLVEFQTALASDGTPVPASIGLRATSIDGISGISTSFSRSVDVGPDGVGDVELLPGHYHVSGFAKAACSQGGCLGNVDEDWVVGNTVDPVTGKQAGKLIQFQPPPQYQGQAFVYGGAPAAGATLSLAASPLVIDSNVLNVGDGSVAPMPATSAGVVGSNGNFTFTAGDGRYVLRVEPDPSTNYPWYVRPGFVLPDEQDALGELDLELPIFYSGTVMANTATGQVPVPQALIRAYAYVKSNGAPAPSADKAVAAIQVAETYSDDMSGTPGAFTLLIPPSLAVP